MRRELLYMRDLTVEEKNGNRLHHMNLLLREGECICVAGASSQRKTLVRYLQGEAGKISGSCFVGGAELEQGGRALLERNKVFVINRNVPYMSSLNVAENIFLLRRNRLRNIWINERIIQEQAEYYMKKFGIPLDVKTDASEMGTRDKILSALVRAVVQNARILVLEDLSGVFSSDDMGTLLTAVNRLKGEGMGILISDSNPEVFYRETDVLTVLRHRKIAKKLYDRNEFCLAERIMRRGLERAAAPEILPGGEAVVQGQEPVLGIRWTDGRDDSGEIRVCGGEIVLFSQNAARLEQLWERLLHCDSAGVSYTLNGEKLTCRTVDGLIRRGIVPVHLDMEDGGIFKNLTDEENILLPSMRRIAGPLGFYKKQGRYILEDDFLFQDGETAAGLDRREEARKLIFYRWKLYHPKAVILYGVFALADVKEKEWLKNMVVSIAGRGTAVLLLEHEKDFCSSFADRVESI